MDCFEKTAELTNKMLDAGKTVKDIFIHLTEEVGELAEAVTVEDGQKAYKKGKIEGSLPECVDLIVCTASLFIAKGGSLELFNKIALEKLAKWEKNEKLNDPPVIPFPYLVSYKKSLSRRMNAADKNGIKSIEITHLDSDFPTTHEDLQEMNKWFEKRKIKVEVNTIYNPNEGPIHRYTLTW